MPYPDSPEQIYLEPECICNPEDRLWRQDPIACEVCDSPAVPYVRADLYEKLRTRLRSAEADSARLNWLEQHYMVGVSGVLHNVVPLGPNKRPGSTLLRDSIDDDDRTPADEAGAIPQASKEGSNE